MSNWLEFAQGLKFKADFHSKMSVCIDMNWGLNPFPNHGNSNDGLYYKVTDGSEDSPH